VPLSFQAREGFHFLCTNRAQGFFGAYVAVPAPAPCPLSEGESLSGVDNRQLEFPWSS